MKKFVIISVMTLSLGALLLMIAGLVMTLNSGIGTQITAVQNSLADTVAAQTSTPTQAQPVDKNRLQIVALGDSLTVGVGDENNQGGYAGAVAQAVQKSQLTNLAVSGFTAPQLLQQLATDAIVPSAVGSADLLLLSIGGNDLHRGGETLANLSPQFVANLTDQFIPRLKEILTMIRTMNSEAPIYVLGLYDPFSQLTETGVTSRYVREWNEAMAATLASFDQVLFIPTFDMFQLEPATYLSDDLFHPNARGYKQIANRVLASLETAISEGGMKP